MSLSARAPFESDSEIPSAPASGVRLRQNTPSRDSKQRRARTGHDHHFLTRLARVSAKEIDLALSLYRDAAVVKAILASPLFPKTADRVAISLDHPKRGPFVIVARNGHFVTCLGRGMSPRRRPIISRDELDAIRMRLSSEIAATQDAERARRCWEHRHPNMQELTDKLTIPSCQKKNLRTLLGLVTSNDDGPQPAPGFVSATPDYPFLGFNFFRAGV